MITIDYIERRGRINAQKKLRNLWTAPYNIIFHLSDGSQFVISYQSNSIYWGVWELIDKNITKEYFMVIRMHPRYGILGSEL